MMMPGREYQAQPSRFGFNGKENDNEVKGFGNQQDYGMRIYDTRLGKFLSVDPLSRTYPMLTPYQFASNTPIVGIDLDGLELTLPGLFRWLSRLKLPEVYIPPPPTIPLPPISVRSPIGISPDAPTTIQPSVPKWQSIDLGDPGVIRIPEIDLEYVPEPNYVPSWMKEKGLEIKKSNAYRPGELDDPTWTGGYKDKKSPEQLKNKSKDRVPDWARGYRPRKGEKGDDFAKRLLDKKYGPGNWKKGPSSEHNQIQKFGDTDFKTIVELPFLMFDKLRKESIEYNKKLKEAKEKVVEEMEQNHDDL